MNGPDRELGMIDCNQAIETLRAENERLRQRLLELEQLPWAAQEASHTGQGASHRCACQSHTGTVLYEAPALSDCDLHTTAVQLMQHTPDAIVVADMDQVITYANAAARSLYGGAELVGSAFGSLFDASSESLVQMLAQVMEQGNASEAFPLGSQAADGHQQVHLSITLIYDAQNWPQAFAATIRDITEQVRTETALRQSQSLLNGIIDHLPATIMVKDTSGTTIKVNRPLATMLGYQPEDLVGQPDEQLFPPALIAEWRALEQRILATGESIEHQEYAPLSDGLHTFLSTKFPLFDEQGAIYAIGGTCIDITERTRIEEALRTSEARYGRAVQAGRVGVWEWDLVSNEMYLSPMLKVMLGYEEHEIDNHIDAWGQHVHPDDRERVMAAADACMRSETTTFEVEHRMLHKDGSVRWVVARGDVFYDAEGKAVRMSGTDTDITDRKYLEEALEAALHHSQSLLQGFLDHSPAGIFVKDLQGTFLLVNQHLCDWMKASQTQIVGTNQRDFFGPEKVQTWIAEDQTMLATGESITVEETQEMDGELHTFLITKFSIYDNEGTIYAIGGISTDITLRKQAEEALRESEAKTRALLSTIPDMMFRVDRQGTYLECHIPPGTVLVMPPEEMIGKRISDIASPETVLPIIDALELAFQTGSVQVVEYSWQDPDALRHYEARIAVVDESTAVGFVRNITERKQAEAALRDSEERYRTVVTNAPVILFTFDTNGIFTLSEGKGLEKLDILPGQMVGISSFDVYSEVSGGQAAAQRALAGEATIWEGDIEGRTFETHLNPFFDSTGQVVKVIGLAVDITERKRAEEALRESQTLLQGIIDNSTAAIYVKDLAGRYLLANRRAAANMEYSRNWVIGKTDAELFPPEFAHAFRATEEQVLAIGQPIEREEVVPQSDGLHTYLSVKFPLHDEQGAVYAVGGISTDITPRKQAEQSLTTAYNYLTDLTMHLSRSRDLLRAIFDGLEDGLLLLDGNGIVQAANKSLAALFGCVPDDMVEQPWADWYVTAAPDFPGHLVLEPPASGYSHHKDIRYQRLDGTTAILDIQIIVLLDHYQAVDQIIMHVVDVTEPVQLQARIIESERFAASGRLAASVAHEINTPLQALQNSLDLARIAPEGERETFLLYAMEEIQRVGRIVSQLLDLYRPNAASPGNVNLNTLVERILLLIGKRIRDQQIDVERDLSPSLPVLWGRADELMQVLLNLMVNALDVMPDGGQLRVHTSLLQPVQAADGARESASQQPAILLKVADSGCGLAPELQARIFEPFVTTKENGTGLGLSIVAQIIKQHGGTIRVKSRPGRGSTFSVTLPVGQPSEGNI